MCCFYYRCVSFYYCIVFQWAFANPFKDENVAAAVLRMIVVTFLGGRLECSTEKLFKSMEKPMKIEESYDNRPNIIVMHLRQLRTHED